MTRRALTLTLALGLSGCEAVTALWRSPQRVVVSTDFAPEMLPAAPALASIAGPKVIVEVRHEAVPSAGADVVWSSEPGPALQRIQAGETRPFERPVTSPSRDAGGAWVGGAGRAVVLLLNERRGGRRPTSVEDVANPAFRGRVAVPPLDSGVMRALRVALTETWGAARADSLFSDLQRNELIVSPDEAGAAAMVSTGRALFAIVGSEVAGAATSGNPTLRVVEPDQDLDGLLLVPSLFTVSASAVEPEAAERVVSALSALPMTGRITPRPDLKLLAANTLALWPSAAAPRGEGP